MTTRALFRGLLAVACCAVALLAAGRADAGIRLTLTSGATTQVYYSSLSTSLTTGPIVIGAYTSTIETTVTNFPGSSFIGTMGQTINIGTVGAAPSSLIAFSEVISDATLGAVTPGLVTGADLALVNAAALLGFTSPLGPAFNISADADNTSNLSVTSGTSQTQTIVDGTTLTTAVNPLTGSIEVLVFGPAPNVAPAGSYNLSQRLTLAGVNAGATGFNINGSSGVTAVPEPTTMAIWSLIGGLGAVGGLRRSRRKA
jgi:hypothetical protein